MVLSGKRWTNLCNGSGPAENPRRYHKGVDRHTRSLLILHVLNAGMSVAGSMHRGKQRGERCRVVSNSPLTGLPALIAGNSRSHGKTLNRRCPLAVQFQVALILNTLDRKFLIVYIAANAVIVPTSAPIAAR